MTVRRSNDPELWGRIRDGESDAFVVVYEELADAVFGYCLRRVGSWESAQDCTSLVFLEAWRLRRTLRSESSGMAWLFGVANNVCRSTARARRRYASLLRRLPVSQTDAGFEEDTLDRVDAELRTAQVLRALSQLPQSQRDVVTLAAWSDLTTAQIGEILHLPPGTVKSRLSRARRRLAAGEDEARTPMIVRGSGEDQEVCVSFDAQVER